EIWQDMLGKVRLTLVEIAGKQFDRQQPPPLEVEQDGEEAVGILAARERNQPALARPHHAITFDRFARLPEKPLAQLVEFDGRGRCPEHRMAGGGVVDLDDGGSVHGCGNSAPTSASQERRPTTFPKKRPPGGGLPKFRYRTDQRE